jgi:hypothetical protein
MERLLERFRKVLFSYKAFLAFIFVLYIGYLVDVVAGALIGIICLSFIAAAIILAEPIYERNAIERRKVEQNDVLIATNRAALAVHRDTQNVLSRMNNLARLNDRTHLTMFEKTDWHYHPILEMFNSAEYAIQGGETYEFNYPNYFRLTLTPLTKGDQSGWLIRFEQFRGCEGWLDVRNLHQIFRPIDSDPFAPTVKLADHGAFTTFDHGGFARAIKANRKHHYRIELQLLSTHTERAFTPHYVH